jgi:putative salt-induced outer membrane protein
MEGLQEMNARQMGILTVLMASFAVSTATIAQAPAEPTPVYTGNIGGGFALTNGNTSTRNFNLTGSIVRAPKGRNVIKGTASYLRGSQTDILNVDRMAINIRDEYAVSNRTFVFGQLDYQRDQFKQMIFFWAPTAGIGYKLINTDSTQFIIDGGAGGVLEKNPGIESSKSGSLTTGERFQRKLSSAATFTEGLASIWKTKDFDDSLTNFSLGLTTTVTGNLQLKLEFIDSYKNKPPSLSVKKNDTAFLTTFVVKF